MVIPTTAQTRTATFLKLYLLKVRFSNKYVYAQVFHTPTNMVAAAASSFEKTLRESMESHADCKAAAKIGEILADRLKEKQVPAISFVYGKDQRYHGKLKALLDSLKDNGIGFAC